VELAQRYGAGYGQIECRLADEDEVQRRMANRSVGRAQWTAIDAPPADAPDGAFVVEPGKDLWASYHAPNRLALDMSRPLEVTLAEALAYLAKL
jgi:hypothetical protein